MRTSQPPANGQSPPRPDTDGEGGAQGGDPGSSSEWDRFPGQAVLGGNAWEPEDITGLPWAACSQGELGLGRRCRSGDILTTEARPHYSGGSGCSGPASLSRREMPEGGWAADAGVQVSEDLLWEHPALKDASREALSPGVWRSPCTGTGSSAGINSLSKAPLLVRAELPSLS